MPRSTQRGDDLASLLTDALDDLLDGSEDIHVQIDLPDGVSLNTVLLTVEATVVDDAVADAEEDTEEVSASSSPAPSASSDSTRGTTTEIDIDELEEEADAAADFIEGVLDAMDLPGDLRIKIDEVAGESEVELLDVDSGALIGRRGQTLEALQELLRCSMQREFERRSRVKVDIEGYRARRLEKFLEKADEAIDDVLDDGQPVRLEPMDVFERKAVHRLVNEQEGVTSRSQGREPGRRVVVEPA